MTVKDFLSVLIRDGKTNIMIFTKDDKGLMTEIGNDNRLFNASLENYHDSEIKFIKLEKKRVFIII